MNTSKSKIFSFILVVVLLLSITCVQFFFNFRGLKSEVAMDQAQIARNIARGEGNTTHVLRPIQLMTDSNRAGINPSLSLEELQERATIKAAQGDQLINPKEFSPFKLTNTRYAPLYPLVEAGIFRLAGIHRFDLWKMDGSNMIYLPDRIVAAISCLFFIGAVLSAYFVLYKIFDSTIACFSCSSLILSDMFLQYATSGLPCMMMLFFFIWGIYFLYLALQKNNVELGQPKHILLPIILSSICFTTVCLSGWIGLWPMVGFILFVALKFRPNGLYAIPPLVILGLALLIPVYMNRAASGSIAGTAFYSICTGFIGTEDTAMRELFFGEVSLGSKQDLIINIIKNILAQGDLLYENLGNLPLALIFIISTLHRFKNPSANYIKWAIFGMWVFSLIGMALYVGQSTKDSLSAGQLMLLFAPFFTAFGAAMTLNIIARHSKELTPILRASVMMIALLVTSLPLILTLPHIVKVGILTSHRGIPAWPPYYPLGINQEIHSQIPANEVVMTDQPAAVSWYADRKTLAMPKLVSHFGVLERLLNIYDGKVGGILISPKSREKRNPSDVSRTYGDFAPLVLEGEFLLQTKDKQPIYLMEHSRALAPLLPRFGTPESRQFIMGANLILYKDASSSISNN